MLKIAFCDDDTHMLERLQAVASDCTKGSAQISSFSSPEQILGRYEAMTHPFDAVFLDIEMPDCDGMELAGKIRTLDGDVLLVFITSHEQFVYRAFEVEAFRYILKRGLEDTLPAVLHAVRNRLSEATNRSFILLHSRGCDYRLYPEEILLVEKSGKNCLYHTLDNRSVPVRQPLTEAEELLPTDLFVQIHSGSLVNLRQISSLEQREVVLTTGRRLPVSRLRWTDVKQRIHRFWSDLL